MAIFYNETLLCFPVELLMVLKCLNRDVPGERVDLLRFLESEDLKQLLDDQPTLNIATASAILAKQRDNKS